MPSFTNKSTIGVVTKMTKKAWFLAVVPFSMVLYLVWMGSSYNRVFAPSDSSRWMFIVPPLALAAVILTIMLQIGRRFIGCRITLSPSHLTYEGHTDRDQLSVAWKSLLYTPPRGQNKMVAALLVANKDRSLAIYDIFTPGFALLCREVAKRKTQSISADSMGNLVIDSGRLGH